MNPESSKALIVGILNLNKPIGLTSRDAVDFVSRPLRKLKVGHAGTLDPLASGVLVLCLGGATRLIEYVQRMPKTYQTVIRLGATSDTLDADGQVVETPNPTIPQEHDVRSAMARQVGVIHQIPPQFSALKVAGQRAYDLARAGETVDLAAREVSIHRIDLLSYEWPRLELEIDCGSGTYIRSIARDLGETLGCGGLVEVLTRTRIGVFTLADAVDPTRFDGPDSILSHLRPPLDALSDLPRTTLDPAQLALIVQGRAIPLVNQAAGEVVLLAPDGSLAAIGEVDPVAGLVSPRRVFAS